MSADPPSWIEVTLRVHADAADVVADAFTEAGAAGVVVEPALRISDDADFAYQELRDEPWTVRASFPAPLELANRRALLRRLDALGLPGGLPPLRYATVHPEDWAETWKQFYTVQHIGRRLVIRPSWEPYEPEPGEVVVELDPGAAFGTGQHETTRLCLAALERHVAEGATVLDVGAGSGILAVAAAKLGAAEVLAVDIDAGAVPVMVENAQRNHVSDRITASAGSVGDDWPWPERPPEVIADLVLANISSTVLVALMGDLARALRQGGILVASGYIAGNADEVRQAASAAGLSEIEMLDDGDWRCLVAAR